MCVPKISRREYKRLKKFYPTRTISIPVISNKFEILESNELVEPLHHGAKYYKNIITQRVRYRLTNKGEIAYEQYRNEHRNIRNVSIRAWIAIVISLIISSLNLLFTWFPIIKK